MSKESDSPIEYEEQCQALILQLLVQLQRMSSEQDDLLSPMHRLRFNERSKLLRCAIAAVKLGPNWKRLTDLRKQVTELQAELAKVKRPEP